MLVFANPKLKFLDQVREAEGFFRVMHGKAGAVEVLRTVALLIAQEIV